MASSKQTAQDELIAQDIKRLHGLGYAQELFRAMGGFSNFAISFTIISVLSGCVTLFSLTTIYGGFTAASIGWPLVTIFVVIVALGMAELASAYPTAGGLYYWASKLGGPVWGWYTGWFNLIGQFAITAGIDYGAAVTLDVLLHAWFPGIPATLGSALGIDPATQWFTLLLYAIILVLHAILNIFGVRIVALLNDVSVWWHIAGVILIAGGVTIAALVGLQYGGASGTDFTVPATHAVTGLNSAGTLFTVNSAFNGTGFPIWYAFLLGLLLAQYTYTGYDASAHMTEETIGAETRAPWGVVMSVGMSSITSNSRMIYAFSRDGAVPFHNLWHSLDRGRTPRNAIILAAVAAFILAVPTVFNFAAYVAVTSIATIGLYIAYALPILLRLMAKDFKTGPWHLGAWSRPIGIIAVVWVVFISILFMLPTFTPISAVTFNYTPVVVLGLFVIITVWWLASARNWFKGPVIQGTAAELSAIEESVGETHHVDVEGAAGGK